MSSLTPFLWLDNRTTRFEMSTKTQYISFEGTKMLQKSRKIVLRLLNEAREICLKNILNLTKTFQFIITISKMGGGNKERLLS